MADKTKGVKRIGLQEEEDFRFGKEKWKETVISFNEGYTSVVNQGGENF